MLNRPVDLDPWGGHYPLREEYGFDQEAMAADLAVAYRLVARMSRLGTGYEDDTDPHFAVFDAGDVYMLDLDDAELNFLRVAQASEAAHAMGQWAERPGSGP